MRAKKQPSKLATWAISRIKGTPAAVIGHVTARSVMPSTFARSLVEICGRPMQAYIGTGTAIFNLLSGWLSRVGGTRGTPVVR
jgi:hypothetical protein